MANYAASKFQMAESLEQAGVGLRGGCVPITDLCPASGVCPIHTVDCSVMHNSSSPDSPPQEGGKDRQKTTFSLNGGWGYFISSCSEYISGVVI